MAGDPARVFTDLLCEFLLCEPEGVHHLPKLQGAFVVRVSLSLLVLIPLLADDLLVCALHDYGVGVGGTGLLKGEVFASPGPNLVSVTHGPESQRHYLADAVDGPTEAVDIDLLSNVKGRRVNKVEGNPL